MANINTGDLSNFPKPDDVESTNKHLWYLLMGDNLLANEDVVHEELKRNCNKILSALTFYPRRPPVTSNSVNTISGIATLGGSDKTQDKAEGPEGEPTTKTLKKPSATNKEAEQRLKARLAKVLDLEESIAWEIFCSFMMFEYKGKATTYSKIMETELHVVSFLNEIRSFYMRERLCLIYCSQIVLAETMNEKNQYAEIFGAFVKSSSLESWVKWLCASFDETVDDTEKVALLHTLAILIFNYSVQEGVMESFIDHYKPVSRGPKSEDVLHAEAVLSFCFLNCGDATDPAHNACIEQFVQNNILYLLEGPYTLAAVLSCLMIRFRENEVVKDSVKEIQEPQKCIPSLIRLVDAYDKNSYKNRHGLSSMILRCVYNSVDIILRFLVKENFGKITDWYSLLSKLLRNNDIAAEFLEGNSSDVVNLYLEAIVQFPIEISPILLIWGSICEAVSESNTCTAVLSQLTEIKYIAEVFDKIDPCDMRFHSDNDRILLDRRVVAGVPVKIGTVGTMIEESYPAIICWILESPCTTTTVWDIIYDEIVNPILKVINEGGRILDLDAEFMYTLLPPKHKSRILEIAEFLTKFGRASRAIPPRLFQLYRPICFILSVLIKDSKSPSDKADYAGLLLRLVDAGSKFNEALFSEFLVGIWPYQSEQNVAAELIIGYESVMTSNYSLSMGLLTATLGIVKETDVRQTPISPSMRNFFTQSVLFCVENIFNAHGWAIPPENIKNEMLTFCLKMLYSLFLLKGEHWDALKRHCVKLIIHKNSSLIAVLEKSEELLQDSIIKPTMDNEKLPEILHYSLSLLLKIMIFNKAIIKHLDNVLNLTLPQKVARFARHRLSTKIPTLAINLLGKIAQEINLSLLSSFGNESDSFRDILIQRLEFKSEDIHLKIAILDFLNVCVHMQNGLIEHFLYDESLLERLLELVNEEEESIQIAALAFVRALFRHGALVIKRVKQIWALISGPLKNLTSRNSLKIATITFNIYSFEAYNNGVVDVNFHRELTDLLKKENMHKMIMLFIDRSENEDTVKYLAAFKHLLVIIFSKPELSSLMPNDTKVMLMEQVYKKFWELNDNEQSGEIPEKRLIFLAELLFHLCPTEDEHFLEDLANKMAFSFNCNIVAVQTSLLSVANSCIKYGKDQINLNTIDNLAKVVAAIFFNSEKVFKAPEAERLFPLLSVAASTFSSLISSERCVPSDRLYQRHYLASSIAHTAYIGITNGVGVQVVSECLSALISMTMRPETCRMVQYSGLVKTLWIPMSKYSALEGEESEKGKAWHKAFILCIHLNTCLLSSQKFYYFEDCLNFWAILGPYYISKLWALPELTNRTLMTNPEKNFNDLKDILMFDVFIVNFASTLAPYFDAWKEIQACEVNKIIEGVFVTLRIAVGLLSQPNHLMLLISKLKPNQNFDFQLTPQLLEVRTKMWDVTALGVHFFCRLKMKVFDYIDTEQLHSTMHAVGQLCIKALTKGDKRSHPSINVTQKIVTTLERSMSLLYCINRHLRTQSSNMIPSSAPIPAKPQTMTLREMSAEVAMMCDHIRRLPITKSEFLIMICTSLETPFK